MSCSSRPVRVIGLCSRMAVQSFFPGWVGKIIRGPTKTAGKQMHRIRYLLATAVLLLGTALAHAQQQPVHVGEISSYSALPQGTEAYKKGWQLALEQVNAAGGVLGGRKLEFLSRDDAGQPDTASRAAQE